LLKRDENAGLEINILPLSSIINAGSGIVLANTERFLLSSNGHAKPSLISSP
jgi:hypothetical protein